MQRLTLLKKNVEEADKELAKVYELRQALIEKNLKGIYSDEIFKEQNAALEDKIVTLRMTKDTDLIFKYNLEEVIIFIKNFFADLGKTYLDSSLTEKRALLGSIFASKLAWSYLGFSNRMISASFQYIRHFEDASAPQGDPLSILHRLREFFDLFLQEGLNSEFAYAFGLKDA